jgi:hypothetical protein
VNQGESGCKEKRSVMGKYFGEGLEISAGMPA